VTPAAKARARPQVFLLSPASTGGERARIVFREEARFDLALRLRSPEGAPLGEVFSFLSGLYFRGKLAYARVFQRPPEGVPGVLVITPSEGLRSPDIRVTLDQLQGYARVPIDLREPRYRKPLERDAKGLFSLIGRGCDVVLLGSVASGKYVEPLTAVFGDRLHFPPAFVGRGDMSRGGLLLRAVDDGELDYAPVAGAVVHGPRPAKLAPRPGILRRALGAARAGRRPGTT
jgi:hypothetical protein